MRHGRGGYALNYLSFNPRTHEGCDSTIERLPSNKTVSIHAPTRGATEYLAKYKVQNQFQSTHPLGVRPNVSQLAAVAESVSIHAPTRGATKIVDSLPDSQIVSIHAPTRGATQTLLTLLRSLAFQSTHPRGVRRHIAVDNVLLKLVSIHAPTRGATLGKDFFIILFRFNPRTHEGCDNQIC